MILIGRYRSPFTRRVAISMRLLDIEYEHRPLTAWSNLADVRAVNPVGRVPALMLDSGETLFDSHAILDYLDQLVGPRRALVPPQEPARHEVLRVTACALGVLEKVVAALYAQTMYPPDKHHSPVDRAQRESGAVRPAMAGSAGAAGGACWWRADASRDHDDRDV